MKSKRNLLFGGLSGIILITFVFGKKILIPNTIDTYAQVLPSRSWTLIRGTNGQINSVVEDLVFGTYSKSQSIQFERGEDVAFSFVKEFYMNNTVHRGDTIAVVESSQLRERIIDLEGELAIAKAELLAQTTGEKESLIKEAEANVELSRSKVANERVLFERAEKLFAKQLISQQEYEALKWELHLLELEVEINQSKLEALKTGIKKESAAVISSQVQSLTSQLGFLKERVSNLCIVSPLDGLVELKNSTDTLLTAFSMDRLILNMPVRLIDKDYLKVGSFIVTKIKTTDETLTGQILSVGNEVKLLEGIQVVFVRILVNNDTKKLLPGMLVECSLESGDTSLNNFLLSSRVN